MNGRSRASTPASTSLARAAATPSTWGARDRSKASAAEAPSFSREIPFTGAATDYFLSNAGDIFANSVGVLVEDGGGDLIDNTGLISAEGDAIEVLGQCRNRDRQELGYDRRRAFFAGSSGDDVQSPQ